MVVDCLCESHRLITIPEDCSPTLTRPSLTAFLLYNPWSAVVSSVWQQRMPESVSVNIHDEPVQIRCPNGLASSGRRRLLLTRHHAVRAMLQSLGLTNSHAVPAASRRWLLHHLNLTHSRQWISASELTIVTLPLWMRPTNVVFAPRS